MMFDAGFLPHKQLVSETYFRANGGIWQHWAKPSGCTMVYMYTLSAGGGGGGGSTNAAGQIRGGGGGGGGGGSAALLIPASMLPDRMYVQVGAGGAGGAPGSGGSTGGYSCICISPSIALQDLSCAARTPHLAVVAAVPHRQGLPDQPGQRQRARTRFLQHSGSGLCRPGSTVLLQALSQVLPAALSLCFQLPTPMAVRAAAQHLLQTPILPVAHKPVTRFPWRPAVSPAVQPALARPAVTAGAVSSPCLALAARAAARPAHQAQPVMAVMADLVRAAAVVVLPVVAAAAAVMVLSLLPAGKTHDRFFNWRQRNRQRG